MRLMSAENLYRKGVEITYGGRKIVAAVGIHAPLPLVRHSRPGYGLDAPPDLGLVQLDGACPGWIKRAAHMTDLVGSALKWGDSATDECRQQIIGRHPHFLQLLDNLVDGIDLRHFVLRVVPPVELRSGGANDEIRQVDQVGVRRILHIKERSKLFPT